MALILFLCLGHGRLSATIIQTYSITPFPPYWGAAPIWHTQMSLQWLVIIQTLDIPGCRNFLLGGFEYALSSKWSNTSVWVYGMLFRRVRWKRLSSTTVSFAEKTRSWKTAVSASRSRTQTCRLSSKRSRYGCWLGVNLECADQRSPLIQHYFLFYLWSPSLILISLNRHRIKSFTWIT